MRVTIIAGENRVNVEGQSETVDLSTLDETVYVIQWYGTVGEVEFKTDYIANTRKANERIDDFTPYKKFVDAWMIEAQKPIAVPVAAVVPNAA